MSTRQLLNMALGAVSLLLVASASLVWNQNHYGKFTGQQIDLARTQQITIQDLGRRVEALQEAEDQSSVTEARRNVGQTVLEFDRSLAVLAKGGLLTTANVNEIPIPMIKGGKARKALDSALITWRETGAPLADLAAGEFSIYSAVGQEAVNGLNENTVVLMEQMGSIANALRTGAVARQAIARLATWGAGIFGLFFLGLVWFRIREGRTADAPMQDSMAPIPPREQAAHLAETLTPPTTEVHPRSLTPRADIKPELNQPAPTKTGNVFTSPLDFDSVNATVDQMTVDMNTIASSTDKMQLAIDSVGHALQGMLYSLKEMAQDTEEGHKIVRGANNAASFTAQAAQDLVASAREMSQVVGRVTQLALRTRQVASQIDAEAVGTGQTGAAFTSVVATEVKGLAQQTSRATTEIEDTVSAILATARQYEEAIGQIIKNISSINKVSQNLGELMLAPPPTVVPGMVPQTTLTPATPPVAAPIAAPEPIVQEPVAPAVPQPSQEAPDPFAQSEEHVVEMPRELPPDEPGIAPEPGAPQAFSLDEDDSPLPTLEEVAKETSEVIEELGLDYQIPEAEKPVPTPAPEPEVIPEPVAEVPAEPAVDADPAVPGESAVTAEPVPEPEPIAEAPEPKENSQGPKGSGSNANVFMLNKPKNPLNLLGKEEATADPSPEATISEPHPPTTPVSEPEPAAKATDSAEVPAPAPKGDIPNIYGLQMPVPEQEDDPLEALNIDSVIGEEPELETVPADKSSDNNSMDAGTAEAKPTVFMLNKPDK